MVIVRFMIVRFMAAGMTACLAAASAGAATLTVEVTGVRSATGTVQAALYADAERFLDLSAAVARSLAKARPGTVVITFKNVKPGTYAVALFHDENGNGKLDSTPVGVPKEGAGFSRNARGMMGPPSFDRASFAVGAANMKVTLRLRYPR